MAEKQRNRLSQALWMAVLMGLGSAGCSAQFSFMAPSPPNPTPQQPPPGAVSAALGPQTNAKNPTPTGNGSQTTARSGVTAAATPSTTTRPATADLAASPTAKPPTTVALNDPSLRPIPRASGAVVQSAYHAMDNPEGDKPLPPAPPKVGAADVGVGAAAPPAGPYPATPEIGPRLPVPTEKAKTMLPAYVIEPPDVLLIDGIRLIPKPPYRIEPLDVLLIAVPNALPEAPIGGPYTVTPEGTVNLGFGYGAFHVAGLTLEQAANTIKMGLRINNPQVSVALAQFRGVQMVRGEHIVGQDGTITLGTYGCVNVTGLTLSQAKCEIERWLSRWLQDPIVSVSIAGYNSKVYYVITDGGGLGEQVYRFPITGNETVLDAIANINGLPPVSNKRRIWLARPTPAQHGCYEILPVDWEAITEAGATATNWQVFPGDRIYVKADAIITLDNELAKILSPIERLFGATLLGSATVQSFHNNGNNNNNGF